MAATLAARQTTGKLGRHMRALKSVAKVLLGLALGVTIAEFVFSLRDGGAFPHLNLYEADADLGVKLQRGAQMKLRVADNPVTSVRTNSLGFRGDEWPAPTPGEVLVVGDSQVFGLGVEEGDTFSAQLSKLLKVPVLNAGVPTYGPREYTAVVEDVVRTRKPATVIYVMNLSNDLFEVDRPNKERHTVWDGWAVRTETAPKDVTNFPFRQTLMSRSHLVFALRKYLHTSAESAQNPGFATEGGWKDVVSASAGVKLPPAPEDATREMLAHRDELATELERVDSLIRVEVSTKTDEDDDFRDGLKRLAPQGGDPRDIVQVRYAEGARRVDETAYQLFMAAVGLDRNTALLQKLADKGRAGDLITLLKQRNDLREKARALSPDVPKLEPRPIDAVLAKTKAACDAVGAKLLVVALPLDVMVSPDEWKKYGVPAIDMSATHVLAEDLVARAEQLGALGVDVTPALQEAEPGAFLDGDLHLTPKGHVAMAMALRARLDAQDEPAVNPLTLPVGRSWPPTEDEWRAVDECTVKGSSALKCETKCVREWLRVVCKDKAPDEEADDPVREVVVQQGGHGDWRVFRDGAQLALILPVLEGDDTKVRYGWNTEQRVLSLRLKNGAREFVFGAPTPANARRNVVDVEWQQNRYPGPLAAVECAEGEVVAGAQRQCAKACDEETPCAAGTCTPWPQGSYCATP